MENYLWFIVGAFQIEIIAFVLMPNHFHLIVRSPKNNLAEAMNYFMRETSKRIGESSGRINQIFGGRFHRTVITTEHYLNHAYKYVYRNPVKAGISLAAEEYPYSTLAGKLGKTPLYIPVLEDNILFGRSPEVAIEWINRNPTEAKNESVKLALRRSTFTLPRDSITKNSNALETEDL